MNQGILMMWIGMLKMVILVVEVFMNIDTPSEANNHNYIDYTKKWDGNFPNASEMGDTGLQGGVDIDDILYTSTLNKYANM